MQVRVRILAVEFTRSLDRMERGAVSTTNEIWHETVLSLQETIEKCRDNIDE